jgi:hypothetical protein
MSPCSFASLRRSRFFKCLKTGREVFPWETPGGSFATKSLMHPGEPYRAFLAPIARQPPFDREAAGCGNPGHIVRG